MPAPILAFEGILDLKMYREGKTLEYHHRRMTDHYSIIDQFSTLNECLQLINQSNIKALKKLSIETALIRMKKLLLNETTTCKGSYGEDVFEGLLCRMQRICGGFCEESALAELLERIGVILTLLGDDQATDARSNPENEVHHDTVSCFAPLSHGDIGSCSTVRIQR